MSVTLLFRTGVKASISGLGVDSLTLDASLREQHTSANTVTRHPVEAGFKITDHKLKEPDTLVMEGVVTNDYIPEGTGNGTPTTILIPTTADGQNGGTLNLSVRSQFDPSRAGKAYQTLLALKDSLDLLVVVTAIRSYDNLVMTALDVTRDPTSGQSLHFTATFQEIQVVQNQQIQIRAKTTKAKKKTDMHNKPAPEASTAFKKKSIWKSASDSGIGEHPWETIKNALSTPVTK